MTDLNPYEEGLALELQEAKGQIKALQKALKDQSSVSDRLAEQLATCEKYRDAYAECDRIGTQAVRDLEAKLAKALEALEVLSDYENLDTSGGYYDGGATIFSYQARKRYGDFDDLARTTLAEISSEAALNKGESHDGK